MLRCGWRGVRALPPVTNRAGNAKPLVAVARSNPSQSVGNLVQEDLLRLIFRSRFAEIPGESDASISMTALTKAGLRVVPGKRPVLERMRSEQRRCSRLNPLSGCHLRRVANVTDMPEDSSTGGFKLKVKQGWTNRYQTVYTKGLLP